MRWLEGVVGWKWRVLLPLSALFELAAFLLFFRTVSRHRPAPLAGGASTTSRRPEPWMLMVIGSTLGFLVTLVVNFAATLQVSINNTGPALGHVLDQRLVTLATWGFLVPAVWGFNARWLPVFLGLDRPRPRFLFLALALAWAAILAEFAGRLTWFAALLPFAALSAVLALHIAEPSVGPAKITGVHPSFPFFVRAGIRVVADRSGFVDTRLLERCEWRHLGRFAARPHRGVPFDHGVRNRPEDTARLLRRAGLVQPSPDAGFTGRAQHRLRVARSF